MSRWPPEPVEVEVIIPVFNDPERLNLCLLALAQQSVPADRFAVTVVDNGSDQLPQLPPLPYAVRLLQCMQQGSYAARNTAIAASSTPLLAFTDADCRPSPTWIETGLAQAESFHLLAGAIRMRPRSAVTPSAADRYELLFGMQQQHYVRAGGFGITANLWVPRALVDQIGPFNALLKSGGDREFCQRARGHGWSLIYADNCWVEHPARTREELLRKARRLLGGRLDRAGSSPLRRWLALVLHLKPMLRELWIVWMAALPWRGKRSLLALVIELRLEALREWLKLVAVQGETFR
jgi:glycosyltransferase involved in cell wall biosynthesis